MDKTIYIFTNSYKPVLGGIQTVTSQVAETLHRRGKRVIVVANLYPKTLRPYERIEGVSVWRLPFMEILSYWFLLLLFALRKPSAVYVHFPLSQAPYVVKLRKHFNFKLITCFHGHDVLRYQEGEARDSKTYKNQYELVHQSDAVTACSCYLARKVETTFSTTGVQAVYNGVELSRYSVQTEAPVEYPFPYIFAFGRLEAIKGFDMLIYAFSEMKGYDYIHLLIAGNGSQHDNLLALAKTTGVAERVHLIGRKTPAEVVQLSQYAITIVIPSFRESFGIVALEALAARRPVIATRAGGLPEVMDERYGELVDPSVSSIKCGIEKTLQNEQTYHFDDVDEYLNMFTIDQMVDNYLKVIE